MANEVAKIITLLGNQGDPVEYTVDQTVAVPKGTLMKISASNTAIAATGDGEFFAGIAAVEVKPNIGTTKLACLTHCVALMTAGTGATTFGQPQKLSGVNLVIDADDDTIENSREVVGLSLATVVDGSFGAVLVNL